MLVEPGMARRESSNQNPKEAPVEVEGRQIWAPVASAGQARNWLDSTEVRRLKGSIEYRCHLMSREEGGECRTARHGLRCCTARRGLRYRTARHGLLKMVPYMNVALVRAWLSHSLRGNAPPRRTTDTLRAAGEPDPPDVVVYAGGALFLAAAGGMVFPSCSRGWAAGGTLPVKIAAGTAAVAVAAVAMRTTVATSPRVAGAAAHGAAAHGASAVDVLADGGPDHRRGARLSACPAGLVHGLHLQSRFGRRPHGKRLTRGTGRSRSNLIEAFPRGPAHVPVLIDRNRLSSQAWTSRSENGGSSFSLLCA